MRHRRAILWAAVAAACAGTPIGLWLLRDGGIPPGTRFRIGYNQSYPANYREGDQPKGVVVEILKEAARRAKIELDWVFLPEGPDRSLTSGAADLWVHLADLPERRKSVYIGRPWYSQDAWAIFAQRTGVSEDRLAAVKSVAHAPTPIHQRIRSASFPAAKSVLVQRPEVAMGQVCRGEVDAAIILDERNVRRGLEAVDDCASLNFLPVGEGPLRYGIGASLGSGPARHAADLLRSRITQMARDGALQTLSFRHLGGPMKEVALIHDLDVSESRLRWLAAGCIGMACLLSVSVWLGWRLRQARLDADAANRSKSQFLAAMSHELRTPMNGIIGTAGLLAATTLEGSQPLYVRTITESANALLAIINDILDFSKAASGKMTVGSEPTDIRDILMSVRELLDPLAAKKKLTLEVDAAALSCPIVMTDPGRLRQIILNLASNAVKFTDSGRVGILVATEQVADGRAVLRVNVQDSGCGIPQDKIDLLFQPFNQVHRKVGLQGTGLGLAISRQLVELMNGEIGLRSQEGVGSEFWFRLPVPIADPVPDAGRPQDNIADQPLTPLRILVAEDNPVNQLVIMRTLENLSMEVELVGDGGKALDRMLASAYDLVLMDNQMPALDGLTATRHARAAGVKTPIIACTAGAMDWELAACRDAGMDDVLTKPIDLAKLRSVLRKYSLPVEAERPTAGAARDAR
jgi:signal transduction histidine kinase/CheY-like chemotaxis protein